MKTKQIAVVALFLINGLAQAAETPPAAASVSEKTTYKILAFRLSQMSIMQPTGYYLTGYLGWNPRFQITDKIGGRVTLGGGYAMTRAGGMSGIAELSTLATYGVTERIDAELGPSFQYYALNGGFQWGATANGLYRFAGKALWVIDHVYAGYTMAFIPTNLTHIIRLGIGTGF